MNKMVRVGDILRVKVFHEHAGTDASLTLHHKTRCGRYLRTCIFRETAARKGWVPCKVCMRKAW